MDHYFIEEWRTVRDWPQYEVSSFGRVRRGEKMLKKQVNHKGYFRVGFSDGKRKRTAFLHVLVLEAFVGLRPDGTGTSHLDGDPRNNWIGNLMWENIRDNCARKLAHGTLKRGSETSRAKLTEEQVLEIRSAAVFKAHGARRRVSNCRELRERYGVCKRTISNIVYGDTWKCAGDGHARAL